MKKGHQQDYSLSVSGGNEKSNFIGTLGYTNQTGISINSGMERFTGRIDANSKWNKFEYGMNATFSWTRNKHTPEGQYYASALYSSKYQLTLPYLFIMRMAVIIRVSRIMEVLTRCMRIL